MEVLEKVLEKHPCLKKPIEDLFENRWRELTEQMLKNDSEYINRNNERAKASRALFKTLNDWQAELFENYSDSICEHEIYEVDVIYKEAVIDTLKILQEYGLL